MPEERVVGMVPTMLGAQQSPSSLGEAAAATGVGREALQPEALESS